VLTDLSTTGACGRDSRLAPAKPPSFRNFPSRSKTLTSEAVSSESCRMAGSTPRLQG
jgi:hypothetical protein